MKLSTSVKFATSASVLDGGLQVTVRERDLSAHLEGALRGIIIADRWPKSGVEVVITIVEVESQRLSCSNEQEPADISTLLVLSGCVTVASAAIVDAGIDCFDLITGGVTALAQHASLEYSPSTATSKIVSDPSCSQCERIVAACLVSYSQSRDELTHLWVKGNIFHSVAPGTGPGLIDTMIDQAVEAAKSARLVLVESLEEATTMRSEQIKIRANNVVP